MKITEKIPMTERSAMGIVLEIFDMQHDDSLTVDQTNIKQAELIELYAAVKAVQFARHCRDCGMKYIDGPDYDKFNT